MMALAKPTARTSGLALVRNRAGLSRGARGRLDEAIIEAHRDGHSLRAIAEAANMNHETVRSIIRKAP